MKTRILIAALCVSFATNALIGYQLLDTSVSESHRTNEVELRGAQLSSALAVCNTAIAGGGRKEIIEQAEIAAGHEAFDKGEPGIVYVGDLALYFQGDTLLEIRNAVE